MFKMLNATSVRKFVVIGIYDKATDSYFAMRRCGKHNIGKWEFPAGKVDPGESLEVAAKRELEEEAGVTAKFMKLAASAHSRGIADPSEDWLNAFYLVERSDISGTPKINEPHTHDKCGWFTVEQLKEMKLLHTTEEFIARVSI